MGVISTNRTALPICGDDFFPVDYLIESPVTTDDEEHEPDQPQLPPIIEYESSRRRRRTENRRFPYFYQNIVGGTGGKKNMGTRKQRRLENSRLLAALVDKDEVCNDLSDTLPETVSAFTQLFLEAEKMKVWNTFIHKSEEEQKDILFGRRRRKSENHPGQNKNNGKGHQREKASNSVSSDGQEEKRQVHPAYSGSACFRRIETRLKTLLTHKHVPWEKLEQFEHDLTDFFVTSPDGVFITVLESGYDRLLLHAVAQYLRLRSQSIGPSDHRETQIESYSDRHFTPPAQTLADFVRQHYGKPQPKLDDGFDDKKGASNGKVS